MYGTPLYVYDEDVLRDRCRHDPRRDPPAGRRDPLRAQGELEPRDPARDPRGRASAPTPSRSARSCSRRARVSADRISYNGNNVDDDELRAVVAAGVHVCVER